MNCSSTSEIRKLKETVKQLQKKADLKARTIQIKDDLIAKNKKLQEKLDKVTTPSDNSSDQNLVEKIALLEGNIADLEKENNRLMEEQDELKKKLSDNGIASNESEPDKASLEKLASLEKNISELENENINLREERNDLKEKLSDT